MDQSNTNGQSEITFDMVAKTFQGLEQVLAGELRSLGAGDVETGRRSVFFKGNLEMLYRANMCCRTALRILKPIARFEASDPDELYAKVKEFDWGSLLSVDKTFSIDTVAYSDDFTHSRFVTYRVKDAIVDWFKDRLGDNQRPRVCLKDADVMLNVHIAGDSVTLSLDSSGESLHKRGWRVAQTEAPINEVLAAGIIMMSGWTGDSPFVDPMCGSGTFLIEAAMIAAGIMPGVYRRHFAFESWPDFDRELFESIYNDDAAERPVSHPIVGADINAKALEIAQKNIRAAGLTKYITLEHRSIDKWTEAPESGVPGVVVTNPPYGERISVEDMEGLYHDLGRTLKMVFTGYHAWVIALKEEYFNAIGLGESFKMPVYNGSLECQLREYIMYAGNRKEFKQSGGNLRTNVARPDKKSPSRRPDRKSDRDRKFDKDRKFDRDRKFDKDLKSDRDRKFDKDRKSDRDRKFDKDRKSDRDRKFDKDRKSDRDRKFDKDRKFDRDRKFDKDRKFDRDRNPFAKPHTATAVENPDSENPLQRRHNPDALRQISGQKPRLSADNETRIGLRRRGWRPGSKTTD